MAGLDSIKHFADGGDVEAATVSEGAIQTTAPKSTGITGKIALDPTQTEAILSNMQKYIDERQGFLPSLATGLSRGVATAYGPSALTAFDRQKQDEDKQIMDYRTQMAAYRAAQAQATNEANLYNKSNAAAPAGGVAGTASGAPAGGGITFPPEIQRQIDQTQYISEKKAIEKKYLDTVATEKVKKANSPAMAAVVDIFVGGDKGMQQMTVAQAEQYLNANPNLKAVVNGEKVPAAQAITAATTAAVTTPTPTGTTGQAVKIATDLGIPIISGDRDWDKQYNLYLDSKKPGYTGNPVAFPGTSKHQTGNAIDAGPLTAAQRQGLIDAGFKQTVPNDKNHWELTTAPATVARSTTTTTQPVQQPNETRAQYDQRIKETGEIVSSRVKEGETERNATLQARQSSIDTGNSISRIENTLNTPEGARAVGVFNKKGVVSAFGKILSEGIQAGNFGSVSFKGLEDAVRAAGGDQATIDAAQRLARDFAQMQLNIAKRDLKGQGAVSDNERRIVEHVTGSTSNSPEVLKDFTRWNRVRNTFDKDVGDALQNWEKSHPNQNYYTFKQSEDYKKLEADYIAKTDAMAAKIGVGKKAAPSDTGNKANEYLKKYGPKKES